ncbi:C2 domain-containing protein 2 [Liparis tanakae]|uniref:C2 domain-containing protein 2 n=1 Tax=Liparis tanakae TaxID=230148 RepID=A0A4Z2IG12_9TELE|nr:C2 domain-containing protein 2 [Liparis tanakae]
MSDVESSGSYLGLADPQWLCMVTLFFASLVTLLLYFVQYFQQRGGGRERTAARDDAAQEEAAALLGWALSLKSWRGQWRGAWCRALNERARKSGSPVLLTFEEDDDLEASELTVSQVSSFQKSARCKTARCSVVGERLQFSLGASSAATATADPCKYTVCIAPVELQLDLQMQEAADVVKVSWGLSQLESRELQVKPTFPQEACLLSPPKPPRAHDWKLLVKNIRVTLNQEEGAAGSLLGEVSVPFDLVKKQPKGQQTFALMTKDVVTGSLTTDFTYLEPSEVRSWHPPTPASNKRVEMDRTVMPCGTVVTTITAVKSKPGRPPLLGLNLDHAHKAVATKSKLSERRVSEQASMMGATVSKALSSSDTELLMLNGTDPVAEAAIRQLHQSAKLKLKSPVKKSTIIISGIAKTRLSQDDELALMVGYAAAMDASMSESSSTQDVTTAIATGSSSPPDTSETNAVPSGIGRPPEDWESQTGEGLDNSSLSMCMSEASCKKRRGSFLQKSAKLFFRRRHQRKEPGMSQSHNDLVYLESPGAVEQASRTATLSRMLSRRSKNKGKANGSTSTGEPLA